MKQDLQLKVQAWLDGELPDGEARRIAEWVAGDAEASALAAELGCIKETMLRNETPATLDESREFYWSKIERQIQREAGIRPAEGTPWFARWRRYLAPALGVAGLACVLVVAVKQARTPAYDEISSTIDGMEAVTFHDTSSQATIVWLQDNAAVAAEVKPVQVPVRPPVQPASVVDM
jgi:hypothetical protein